MAKTEKKMTVRTLVGYGVRKGQTYVNVRDLMLYFLDGIEEDQRPEVVKDRRHIVDELSKLLKN